MNPVFILFVKKVKEELCIKKNYKLACIYELLERCGNLYYIILVAVCVSF
jgi:hypothetical protein